jgi:predicted ATPase
MLAKVPMQLSRVEIRNYKSLRDVTIEPGAVSVFVGPNAAGKTNLVDALDFLGDVYRWGLEAAVSHKGGYENICYRHSNRTKAPIGFRIVLKHQVAARKETGRKAPHPREVTFDHTFEFRTSSRGIGAPFKVTLESLLVYEARETAKREVLQVTRKGQQERAIWIDDKSSLLPKDFNASIWLERVLRDDPGDLILLLPRFLSFIWLTRPIKYLASLRVFQLSPRNERQLGVPTPNPDLDRYGANLPAVIAFLQREHPKQYEMLLDWAKRVMPWLETIETDFTHTKSLALFLGEKGLARPWPADDVSDGTLQTIALLTAVFDPRAELVVIEEPENSVHPWALRNLVAAARQASASKQIILTTHSPILIDQLRPEELWIVQRPAAETRIDPLLKLDPSLSDDWGKGKFTLSAYLDSGAVPDAVPSVAS